RSWSSRPGRIKAPSDSALASGASPSSWPSWRRVRERQHRVARALDLDDKNHALLGVGTHRELLADVLAGDPVHDLELRIGPPLDDPASKLRLAVRVVHGHDGQRHAGIAPGVL